MRGIDRGGIEGLESGSRGGDNIEGITRVSKVPFTERKGSFTLGTSRGVDFLVVEVGRSVSPVSTTSAGTEERENGCRLRSHRGTEMEVLHKS